MAMSCKAAFWLALKPMASPTAAPNDIAFQKSIIPLLFYSIAVKRRENKAGSIEMTVWSYSPPSSGDARSAAAPA
jgi:hypothetical protein